MYCTDSPKIDGTARSWQDGPEWIASYTFWFNDDNVYILSPPLVNQLLRDERLLTARENAAGKPRAPGCSLTFPTRIWISVHCEAKCKVQSAYDKAHISES